MTAAATGCGGDDVTGPRSPGTSASLSTSSAAAAGLETVEVETVRLTLLPGADEGIASAVSNSGIAVGSSEALVGRSHAARWSASGAIEDLTPEAFIAGAVDVNDRGAAVGRVIFRTGARIGVRWGPGGSPTVLPALVEGVPARPLAINDRGQIAGFSGLGRPSGTVHAVRWSPSGDIRDLEEISDRTSEARGINDRGTVVGQFFDGDGIGAFVWTEAEGMTSLPGDDPFAVAVNDSGQIVGGSAGPAGRTRATLWTADREVVLLETRPGIDESHATDINDRGEVVGIVEIDDRSFPFFWSPEDSSLALLSSRPGQAGGINDSSVVAGSLLPAPFSPVAVLWRVGRAEDSLVVELQADRSRVEPVLHRCFLADLQTAVRRDEDTNECVPGNRIGLARTDTTRLRISARQAGDGSTPDSVRLSLVSQPVAGSGGHDHSGGRPRGTFFAGARPAVDDPDAGRRPSLELTLRGRTDTAVLYRTSGVGGRERIRLQATGFVGRETLEATAADTVAVRLDERLVPLPPLSGVLKPVGSTDSHPANTWGTRRTVRILEDIARSFHEETGRGLAVNDMSLRFGGLFDCAVGADSDCTQIVGEERPWRPPHLTHRRGNQADIRNRGLSKPERRLLKRIIKDDWSGLIYAPEAATHFHTTFLEQ